VHYTTSCNTQSSAPEDGRDQRPKYVELAGIVNKPLLLHLVGIYIVDVNDARSNKYQMVKLLVLTCTLIRSSRHFVMFSHITFLTAMLTSFSVLLTVETAVECNILGVLAKIAKSCY
jgi:hypothetical protein